MKLSRHYFVPAPPRTFSGLAFCLILGTFDAILIGVVVVRALFR